MDELFPSGELEGRWAGEAFLGVPDEGFPLEGADLGDPVEAVAGFVGPAIDDEIHGVAGLDVETVDSGGDFACAFERPVADHSCAGGDDPGVDAVADGGGSAEAATDGDGGGAGGDPAADG